MTSKIEQSYTKGVQAALEKIAFGEFLSNLMPTNPNRAKAEKGMGDKRGIRYMGSRSKDPSIQHNTSSGTTSSSSTTPPPPSTGG